MFAASMQPSLVSLFSSTGSDPLILFTVHKDASLPSDSVVHLLNDSSLSPPPASPEIIISAPCFEENSSGYSLDQSVLHIQSPTLPTTFVHCPPINESFRSSVGASGSRAARGNDLGMKHPWIHMQVRNLGREWSFEVGLVDQSGRHGVVRCSTFQVLRISLYITISRLPRVINVIHKISLDGLIFTSYLFMPRTLLLMDFRSTRNSHSSSCYPTRRPHRYSISLYHFHQALHVHSQRGRQ
jgi:hypothetical protein